MSDERKLVLSFAPSLAVRLLRHEATLLSSEATLVYFIASELASGKLEDGPSSPVGKGKAIAQEDESQLPISSLIPNLIKHCSNTREMGYPYSIFSPQPGVPLSTLSIYLSISERHLIDKSVGRMARKLASLTSPNGTFGTVTQVLPDAFAAVSVPSTSATTPPEEGARAWSEAFNALLEGALRDGEDQAVLLPYETVRAHYARLAYRLDAVTLPRLVILDIGSETNILLSRTAPEAGAISQTDRPPMASVNFTGLRSWAQGIFGDPLIADAFDAPSEGFLEGWKEECNADGDGDGIIEDEKGAQVRMLLYRCFRAVVGIVTEYYRPQGDSSRRELEARRGLTAALTVLEKVDVVVGEALKRVRTLSSGDGGEGQAGDGGGAVEDGAKRVKIEERGDEAVMD